MPKPRRRPTPGNKRAARGSKARVERGVSPTPLEAEAEALRLRVQACVAEAVAQTARGRGDENVHGARQALKRGRAALRLLEAGGVKAARQHRRKLAGAARRLSPLRDAAVAAILAAQLARDEHGRSRSVARVMADAKPRRPAAAYWRKWHADLTAISKHLDGLSLRAWEPGSLAVALEHSARKVRRTARRFDGGHDLDHAHEWRKALVTLREQALDIFPAAIPEVHHRLHQVTHRLGRALDCRLLRGVIEKRSWPKSLGRAPEKFAAHVRRRERHWLERAWHSWRKLKPLLGELPIAEARCA